MDSITTTNLQAEVIFFQIIQTQVCLPAEQSNLAFGFKGQPWRGNVGDTAVLKNNPRVAYILFIFLDYTDTHRVNFFDFAAG